MVNAAGSIWGVMPYSFSVAVVMGPMEATVARAARVLKAVLPHQPGEVVDRAGAGEGEDVHPALRQRPGGLRGQRTGAAGRDTPAPRRL